jgi:hypothetical protein
MKPASEQMHFGFRLQELGIAFNVQFCYEVKMLVESFNLIGLGD